MLQIQRPHVPLSVSTARPLALNSFAWALISVRTRMCARFTTIRILLIRASTWRLLPYATTSQVKWLCIADLKIKTLFILDIHLKKLLIALMPLIRKLFTDKSVICLLEVNWTWILLVEMTTWLRRFAQFYLKTSIGQTKNLLDIFGLFYIFATSLLSIVRKKGSIRNPYTLNSR